MARRTFFSFHYEHDVSRANVVRNSWVTQDREAAGFFDASLWEEARTKGQSAVEALIDKGLENTSVTVVLIGRETAQRPYVLYEVKESYARGNGLLGVNIYKIRNLLREVDDPGENPFDKLFIEENGSRVALSSKVPVYNWNNGNGYQNLGTWIEAAAKKVGRQSR